MPLVFGQAEAGSGPPTLKIKVADDDDELSDHEGEGALLCC